MDTFKIISELEAFACLSPTQCQADHAGTIAALLEQLACSPDNTDDAKAEAHAYASLIVGDADTARAAYLALLAKGKDVAEALVLNALRAGNFEEALDFMRRFTTERGLTLFECIAYVDCGVQNGKLLRLSEPFELFFEFNTGSQSLFISSNELNVCGEGESATDAWEDFFAVFAKIFDGLPRTERKVAALAENNITARLKHLRTYNLSSVKSEPACTC